jgi:hypothetical protein
LTTWFKLKGKFFVNYHHLKCFGVYHASNDKVILTSESDKESIDTNNKLIQLAFSRPIRFTKLARTDQSRLF